MRIDLASGKGHLEVDLNGLEKISIITTNPPPVLKANEQIIADAFSQPIDSPTLGELLKAKKPNSVVIIVNDITRPTPYNYILPPLLKELHESGISKHKITIVIALGIHRPHTEEENRKIYGDYIVDNYRVINHDCDDKLATIGTLANGMALEINETVAQADFVITTGLVELHYFAGYSGGRKSILPGIASRRLIEANHKMMDHPQAFLGNYTDNPVGFLMQEAAEKVGVDFIVNIVMASKEKIAFAVSGNIVSAWLEAVKYCESTNVVTIPHKADIVIASAGGFPKDINLYQAQKALDSAALAVKENGTIILVAECTEGFGEEVFEKWVLESKSLEDIRDRFYHSFQLGGHKAFAISRVVSQCRVILVSKLDRNKIEKLHLIGENDVGRALRLALESVEQEPEIIVMPEAPKCGVKLAGNE